MFSQSSRSLLSRVLPVVFGVFLAGSSTSHADYICPAPLPDAQNLFHLIATLREDSVEPLREFLGTHTVAMDALNERCETVLTDLLRRKRFKSFRYVYEIYRKPNPNRIPTRAWGNLYMSVLAFGNEALLREMHERGGKLPSPIYRDGANELMIAAHYGNVELAKFLLLQGAPVNAESMFQRTALIEAAAGEEADARMIRLLLAAGADTGAADFTGFGVLQSASRSVEKTEELLKAGADVDGGKLKWTPLMAASNRGSSAVVELLLRRKADVDRVDGQGRSALFYAVGAPLEVATLLIRGGASVNLEDRKGTTVLQLARKKRDKALVDLLIQAGADGSRDRKDDEGREGT